MPRNAFSLICVAGGLGIAALLTLAPTTDAGARGKSKSRKSATGHITGVISFKGTPPKAVAIPKSDPFCAKHKPGDERVVVRDGKLKDVYVGLPNGSAGSHPAPAQDIVVDQSGCMYRPRVVGAIAGQKVKIKNSDMTFHNVRGHHGKRHAFNHAHPQKFPPITESAGKVGQKLTLRCDVHPWMRAYAVVSDHPFFSVSKSDGSFLIKNAPVGSYELEAWHPELGKRTVSVRVKSGETTTLEIEFK